jgi:hypothetical protein
MSKKLLIDSFFLREGWERKARNAMRTCNGQPDGG